MKVVNEQAFEKLDLSLDVIVQPSDKANSGHKGNKVKRKLDGNDYIAFAFIDQIRTLSNSQLRLRLASETDKKRIESVRKVLKERGALK